MSCLRNVEITRLKLTSSVQYLSQSVELSTLSMSQHASSTPYCSTESPTSKIDKSFSIPASITMSASNDSEHWSPCSVPGRQYFGPDTSNQHYCSSELSSFEDPVLRLKSLDDKSTRSTMMLANMLPMWNDNSTCYNSNVGPLQVIRETPNGPLIMTEPLDSSTLAQTLPGQQRALPDEQIDFLTYDFLPDWTLAESYGPPDLFTTDGTVEHTGDLFDSLDCWICHIDGCGKRFHKRHRYK